MKVNETANANEIVTGNTGRGLALNRSNRRVETGGRTAVRQARLALLVMINIAQLWILSATIEAALAAHYKQLIPLVIASGVCWLIALTIFLWWKPAENRPAAPKHSPDR